MKPSVEESLLSLLKTEPNIKLSTEGLARGINNYHIDVKLSRKYCSDIKKLTTLLVPQTATPKPKAWDNSKQLKQFRYTYFDMMTVLIHRVKTDLTVDHVNFLQLAAIKHLLQASRSRLDAEIRDVGARLADLKSRGASEALAIDQRLFWLKRNYDTILYNVNKPFFAQIKRAEDQELSAIREQFLGADHKIFLDLILNPLLWTATLSNMTLQLNEYSLWDTNGEESGVLSLDLKIVDMIGRRASALKIPPINENKPKPANTEIHDELGGLFQLQNYTGPSEDTKENIEEEFLWIELTDNIDILFDGKVSANWLSTKREEKGFFGQWKYRKEINTFNKLAKYFSKELKKDKLISQLIASNVLKKLSNSALLEHLEVKTASHFLIGRIPLSKLQESISGNHKLNSEQIKSFEKYRDNIADQVKTVGAQTTLKLLHNVGKFRRDLKLFRFAHRAFNRINILKDVDDIRLSRSAGTLYQLPIHSEVEEADAKICHHTILKADVRGSTTVTDELLKKGLNPASYFSMRFFNPINKILETYCANKVFIEGDAIILSFLEHEHVPEQWFSVARACGYAKDMLLITGASNRYSNQMGLPLLELGVGICYSNDSPRFLYDEDHPIMISGAIGLADRMSGCSWNLRAAIKKSLFNVDVLQIAEGESSKGEKGQHYARYNVNGVNIDDLAFEKLKSEISLKRLKMKLNGEQHTFFLGKYPDMNGQKKDLIIRQGNVGIWANNEILAQRNTGENYYEVVVSRKIISAILEAAKTSPEPIG
jgi:hypothetical protein